MTSSPECGRGWLIPSFDAPGETTPAGPAWPPPELPADRMPWPGPAAEPLFDATYEQGFADGRRQGEAEARRELGQAAAALLGAARELAARQAEFARDRERNLQALALIVAQKLFEREVAADPAILQPLLSRALELLPEEEGIAIRLHPADLQHARAELERLEGGGPAARLKWIADPGLGRGSFLLETPLRVIDGRTDTALRHLYERLHHD
jgi:flagellar assembly protein FliH